MRAQEIDERLGRGDLARDGPVSNGLVERARTFADMCVLVREEGERRRIDVRVPCELRKRGLFVREMAREVAVDVAHEQLQPSGDAREMLAERVEAAEQHVVLTEERGESGFHGARACAFGDARCMTALIEARDAGMDQLPGFRTLPPAERALVKDATREVVLAKGAIAFSAGEPSTYVWAVHDGLVHIVKSGPGGREIVLEVIPPGELFGAVVALEDRPYPASAIVVEPSTVWRVPSALVRAICQRHPTLRSAILALVTARLRSAHERLQSVALEPVEQRLARMLLALVPKIGRKENGFMVLPVTRQELADMVGTTVETTIRITSKWQKDRIVRSARNALTIADVAALRALAAGEDG